MANVKLYDKNGAEQIFEGVETITLDSPVEGETETFSHGIAVEDLPIAVNFSSGDMEIDGGGYLVKSAIILKPENLMPENIVDGVNVAGVVGTHKGGGGGDYTVTFMNGSTKLYERQVLSGNTCGDVAALGLIDTPTKTPSATVVYNFSGWSLTSGGAANSSALANITADRTVYAAFTSSTRYYTVRFFDGATLIDTVQVQYNQTAECSETITKEGYFFDGWQPSNANIKADTDCYAQWVETPTFANATWEQISQISRSGRASQVFKVGNVKQITLTNGEKMSCSIVGFDHDDLSDGTGKAGITIKLQNLPNIAFKHSQLSVTDNSYYSGVIASVINLMPADISTVTVPVEKECVEANNGNFAKTTKGCTFWLPSFAELNRAATEYTSVPEEGYIPLGTVYAQYSTWRPTNPTSWILSTTGDYSPQMYAVRDWVKYNDTVYKGRINADGTVLAAGGNVSLYPHVFFCV